MVHIMDKRLKMLKFCGKIHKFRVLKISLNIFLNKKKCCTISNCGNYFLVGYSSGHVDLYNIQSGLFRGTYGKPNAHKCSVRGVCTDSLNLTTITCGENGEILFWPFKDKKILHACIDVYNHRIELNETIDKIVLHRER